MDLHEILFDLSLLHTVVDDETKVACQHHVVQDGRDPELDHETLNGTGSLVAVHGGRATIFWNHDSR